MNGRERKSSSSGPFLAGNGVKERGGNEKTVTPVSVDFFFTFRMR